MHITRRDIQWLKITLNDDVLRGLLEWNGRGEACEDSAQPNPADPGHRNCRLPPMSGQRSAEVIGNGSLTRTLTTRVGLLVLRVSIAD